MDQPERSAVRHTGNTGAGMECRRRSGPPVDRPANPAKHRGQFSGNGGMGITDHMAANCSTHVEERSEEWTAFAKPSFAWVQNLLLSGTSRAANAPRQNQNHGSENILHFTITL